MSIRKLLVPLSGHSDPADPEALELPALESAFVVAAAPLLNTVALLPANVPTLTTLP